MKTARVRISRAMLTGPWAGIFATAALAAVVSWGATLPRSVIARAGHCSGDSAAFAHSWMRLRLYYQARQSAWAPPWFPRYAPRFVAESPEAAPGSFVTITQPDTFGYGTVFVRAAGPGGESCDSNYLPSRRAP